LLPELITNGGQLNTLFEDEDDDENEYEAPPTANGEPRTVNREP
jgi:hypothetical protein